MNKKNHNKSSVPPLKDPSIKYRRRGIIYLRSNHWADSLLAQESLCRTFCDQDDIELVDVYADQGEYVTALDVLASPGFSKVLAYCQNLKNRVGVLIVVSRDRLGKDTAEYLDCKVALAKVGVEILGAADTEIADSSLEEILESIAAYNAGRKS